MDKAAIIYWSGTGHTEAMANAVAEGMASAGVQADVFSVSDFTGSLNDYSKVAFGCPAMGDEVLEESEFEPFFSGVEDSLSDKTVTLFGSYDWGDGQWMRDWQERVKPKCKVLYGDGLIVNNEPDDEGLQQCRELGKAFAELA